jgi:hypothetical protein
MVPRTGRGLPFFLQVIQEGFDQRNVDLFETQFFRSDSLEVATESQKQSKHVPVCLDGIRAEIPLRGQVMGQETGHVNGKIGGLHRSILLGMTSPKAAFTRVVISGKISAVR